MNVLLLSAYHAESHRQWAEGLMQNCVGIKWSILTLPPRHFNWRIRGNSLSWAMLEKDLLCAGYDAILATSMTDLSALKGMVPDIAAIPSAVYFHENQFAYPASGRQQQNIEPCMVNLYAAMAADKILFNSDYNRRSFTQGCDDLLRRLPDYAPRAEVLAKLQRDAEVLPVGITKPLMSRQCAPPRLQLLWNHRWEYDKGPELLLEIIRACEAQQLAIDFHIVGQQFRDCPDAFAAIHQLLLASGTLALASWGYVEQACDYQQLLADCDVVLSTAEHDFQGLSVMEAVAAGCVPLLPNRLCYPEFYPANNLYGGEGLAGQAIAACEKLIQLLEQKKQGPLLAQLQPPSVEAFYWQQLAPRYQSILAELRR